VARLKLDVSSGRKKAEVDEYASQKPWNMPNNNSIPISSVFRDGPNSHITNPRAPSEGGLPKGSSHTEPEEVRLEL